MNYSSQIQIKKGDEEMAREIKKELVEKASKVANDLFKNLSPKEALAVLEMAKILVEEYKGI